MATYVPNANQTAEPVASQPVESAALEFRTLKTHAVQFNTTDAETSKTRLPADTIRAGKYLAFDSLGRPIAADLLPATLYLGAFDVAPITRNSGEVLVTGDLYFNTVDTRMWVYDILTGWVNYELNTQTSATAAAASAGASATSASAALTSEQNADVSEVSALAAKVAAESARDAALIQAGVYVDEPTGRAAVADGVAFKVQGSGDVAAYEYRRVSAGVVSTLIATYPSADSQFLLKSMPPESGYVWALVDSNNRAAVLVNESGEVYAPKLSLPDGSALLFDLTPSHLNEESGYAWALVDSLDAIALAVTPDGKIQGNFDFPYLKSTSNLYCIGDSLTAGAGPTPWPTMLLTSLPGRIISNTAIGGQTSTHIAARMGAKHSLLTLAGNQIPASGPVAVSSLSIDLLNRDGVLIEKPGSISGIPGLLSKSVANAYTFTRTTAGSVVNVTPKTPFTPNIYGGDFDVVLIFIGTNNTSVPYEVIADIEAVVTMLKPIEKRFLILTPTNGGTITPGVAAPQAATVANIEIIENYCTEKYGDNVLKLREWSWQFSSGSADDISDVANGTVPRSLRIDTVHYTEAHNTNLAALVTETITRKGW